ncbi:hypothetical protein TD95_002631 [Thielaviopsis punctulata]|uniref:Uncharacterized protein n=1 Tax=Thielaviopsis punctulata TaxID=72032 RepID=A0A0F4ZK56_9PEZI|nr:hypothetical protein TD95_002631 [Thielaviopsis punctulata]
MNSSTIAQPVPAASPETTTRLDTTAPLQPSRSTATDASSDATLHEEKNADVRTTQVLPSPTHGHDDSFDVEAQAPSRNLRKSITLNHSDCQVWPGQDHWKRKAKAAKKERSITCLARLSKRNRIIAKVVLGVLIIGIAVAVGFGVSKPLGAPIWGDHSSK